jgi:putative Holliday junction resolvase
MSIDFGEKRIGLAVSDSRASLAVPLRAIHRKSDDQAAAAIAATVAEEEITHLVLGLPLGLDGREGSAARRVRSFARKLAEHAPLPLVWVNESLSSREAEERLRERGFSARKIKAYVDSMAAVVILEDALAAMEAQEGQ